MLEELSLVLGLSDGETEWKSGGEPICLQVRGSVKEIERGGITAIYISLGRLVTLLGRCLVVRCVRLGQGRLKRTSLNRTGFSSQTEIKVQTKCWGLRPDWLMGSGMRQGLITRISQHDARNFLAQNESLTKKFNGQLDNIRWREMAYYFCNCAREPWSVQRCITVNETQLESQCPGPPPRQHRLKSTLVVRAGSIRL